MRFIICIYHILFISCTIQGYLVYFQVLLPYLLVISFLAGVTYPRNPKCTMTGWTNIPVQGWWLIPVGFTSCEVWFPVVVFFVQISIPIELCEFGSWKWGLRSHFLFLHTPPRAKARFLLRDCAEGDFQSQPHGCASLPSPLLWSEPRP